MQRIVLPALIFTSVAFAQNPPGVPVPPAPGIPGDNPAPARNGLAANPVEVLREDQIFPKMTGDELADLYLKFTGRRVTVSVAAAAAEFRFIQRAPMTYGEAAKLLKKAALLEGFVFVPDPLMEAHDILVNAPSQAGPGGEAIPTITDPADLPEDDQVITYVMNLKYIKPEEVVRTFTTIVGQFGAYGSITPVANAGAVVITEKTSLIRRLIELQEQIDVSASVATRFIKVRYADVEELTETLNEILNTQQDGQRSAGVQRVGNNSAPPTPPGVPAAAAAAAAGGSSAAEDVPIQIVADSRTNRIFAMGRPVDIVFIEGLVAEFDTATDERNFLRRKLRFVAVSEFLEIAEPALERAFSGGGNSSSGGGGSSTGANFGGSTRNTSSTSRNTSSSSRSSRNSSSGGFGNTGGGSAGSNTGLGDPTINSAPEARLVGRTLLVADNITNSLVVQGPPAAVEIITNLLDEIDVKADQVMISAVFGQLTLGDDFSFGVDYVQALNGDRFAGRGGSGAFPSVPLGPSFDDQGNQIPGGLSFNPGSLASAAGLSLYGQIGDDFNVIVNALQSDSRFKVLSRPTIFTANNRKGSIQAGERIAVPTNSFQGGGVNGISTNIEYQDVLLSLEVIPLINSEDEVTLEIALINDEVIGSQFIEGVGDVPTIGTRDVTTTVTVPDGSTIVLGGLIVSRKRETVSGIPLLSDIPGLGKLFSSTSIEDDRAELMVFIQPKIVKDSKTLYDAQVDMDARYDIAPESHQFANGPAVLPEPGSVQAVSDKGVAGPEPQPEEESRSSRKKFGRPSSAWRR